MPLPLDVRDTEALIDGMDWRCTAAGLPTYTELAQLLNDLAKADPDPRTAALAAEALAILHLEMKLVRP